MKKNHIPVFLWIIATIILSLILLYFEQTITVAIFLSANISTFFLYGIDKLQAQAKRRRVPEKTLHLTAFLGGSLGALIAMKFFRHKTQKLSFQLVLGLLILVQLLLIYKLTAPPPLLA